MKTRRHLELCVPRPGTRPVPLWRELADALAWQIDIGRLPAGSRLPATRTLAHDLALSRNTVMQAYDELVSLGYLRLRVGDGAYVCRLEERATAALPDRLCTTGVTPEGVALVLIQ